MIDGLRDLRARAERYYAFYDILFLVYYYYLIIFKQMFIPIAIWLIKGAHSFRVVDIAPFLLPWSLDFLWFERKENGPRTIQKTC